MSIKKGACMYVCVKRKRACVCLCVRMRESVLVRVFAIKFEIDGEGEFWNYFSCPSVREISIFMYGAIQIILETFFTLF
jgi:hypothetical protein